MTTFKVECRECGSAGPIQRHHKIPGNNDSQISLCADCHSRKHPNVPRNLFFSDHTGWPSWENRTMGSIARELEVHPRTVARIIRRLRISVGGHLSSSDEELIESSASKHRWRGGGRVQIVHLEERDLLFFRCLDAEIREVRRYAELESGHESKREIVKVAEEIARGGDK